MENAIHLCILQPLWALHVHGEIPVHETTNVNETPNVSHFAFWLAKEHGVMLHILPFDMPETND